ncbi:uncharacterized protein LOC111255063, partial [Varroa destructor]|uniref:Reverse transcriptase domain-containing protein n=1 Tax=Varroa destructor TaxID=109461 RepID=A0A7M7KXT4_VARDE
MDPEDSSGGGKLTQRASTTRRAGEQRQKAPDSGELEEIRQVAGQGQATKNTKANSREWNRRISKIESAAHDLLEITTQKYGIHLCLLSEPSYKRIASAKKIVVTDDKKDTAIYWSGMRNVVIRRKGAGNGFYRSIGHIYIYMRDEATIEINERDVSEVTLEEITEAGNKIAAGKAPESDGVPPEVVKMLIKRWPRILQKLANDILRRGKFPDIWKEANLVLIPKPGNKTGPTAFRPICLLNTAAKAIERIIVNRLNKEIE